MVYLCFPNLFIYEALAIFIIDRDSAPHLLDNSRGSCRILPLEHDGLAGPQNLTVWTTLADPDYDHARPAAAGRIARFLKYIPEHPVPETSVEELLGIFVAWGGQLRRR